MTPLGDKGTPWYREFWPWFLFGLPAVVVVAGLSTLVIANRHADDVVVADYYKEGLAINRLLARKKRAEELGISAELTLQGTTLTARLTGDVSARFLNLSLAHPLEADRDRVLQLERVDNGLYQGQLASPSRQRWHWRLTPPGDDGWLLDGTLLSPES